MRRGRTATTDLHGFARIGTDLRTSAKADLNTSGTDQLQKQGVFRGKHADVSDAVIRVFYEVYNELGGGFLESVYHGTMSLALRQAGLLVASEVPIPVCFRGVVAGAFRADLVVEDCLVVELKAVHTLDRMHDAEVVHYLRATSFEVGLILNFGPKAQIQRIVLDTEKKKIRVPVCESLIDVFGG